MPAIIPIATVVASYIASRAAAHSSDQQTAASNRATTAQTHANDSAETFQRQQAETDWRNNEAAQRANYDQYMARYHAAQQLAGQMNFTLPDAHQYQGGIDPHYDDESTPAGKPTFVYTDQTRKQGAPGPTPTGPTGSQPPTGAGPTMPQGIDPRLADLYRQAGVTPGERGSGAADWQYWQNEALRNANGDWGYVLGRLKDDLAGKSQGGSTKSSSGSGSMSTSYLPTSVSSYLTSQAVPTVDPLRAPLNFRLGVPTR